jgi:hypothetical protein
MLYEILLGLAILYALDRLHSLRREGQILDYRYQLYEIRDHIREAAMKGEVDCRNWVFMYLDSSLVKTIDALPRISLWQTLVTYIAHRKDEHLKEAARHLERELNKPANKFLRDAYTLYVAAMIMYLMERHALYSLIAKNLLRAVSSLQRAGKLQTQARSTSTLVDHAFA